MNYNEALNILFNKRSSYEKQGNSGYKPGLQTTLRLAKLCDYPQNKFKSIHIAGTNGKGSVANMIAAILQTQGYKVGLFTSPHIVDFTERIRVNGEKINHNDVCDFLDRVGETSAARVASFFELTTIMAFDYFAKSNVDFAVIEVGLGGRLDSTNIITPILSVITNISLDHMSLLGNTVEEIAGEKAGIIKSNVPVVIGKCESKSVKKIFDISAKSHNSKIIYSEQIVDYKWENGFLNVFSNPYGHLNCSLTGLYQVENIATALSSIQELNYQGIIIDNKSIAEALENVQEITGFYSRWTVINKSPLTICDPAHNIAGWKFVVNQINKIKFKKLRMIIGFVADKDVESILKLIASVFTKVDIKFYFTQMNSHRALNAIELEAIAMKFDLKGETFETVKEAYKKAITVSNHDDLIFIGGSFYLLSEIFSDQQFMI